MKKIYVSCYHEMASETLEGLANKILDNKASQWKGQRLVGIVKVSPRTYRIVTIEQYGKVRSYKAVACKL